MSYIAMERSGTTTTNLMRNTDQKSIINNIAEIVEGAKKLDPDLFEEEFEIVLARFYEQKRHNIKAEQTDCETLQTKFGKFAVWLPILVLPLECFLILFKTSKYRWRL